MTMLPYVFRRVLRGRLFVSKEVATRHLLRKNTIGFLGTPRFSAGRPQSKYVSRTAVVPIVWRNELRYVNELAWESPIIAIARCLQRHVCAFEAPIIRSSSKLSVRQEVWEAYGQQPCLSSMGKYCRSTSFLPWNRFCNSSCISVQYNDDFVMNDLAYKENAETARITARLLFEQLAPGTNKKSRR